MLLLICSKHLLLRGQKRFPWLVKAQPVIFFPPQEWNFSASCVWKTPTLWVKVDAEQPSHTWGFCEPRGKSHGSASALAAQHLGWAPDPSTARWCCTQTPVALLLSGRSQGTGLLQVRNEAAVNKEECLPTCVAVRRKQGKKK